MTDARVSSIDFAKDGDVLHPGHVGVVYAFELATTDKVATYEAGTIVTLNDDFELVAYDEAELGQAGSELPFGVLLQEVTTDLTIKPTVNVCPHGTVKEKALKLASKAKIERQLIITLIKQGLYPF